MDRSARRARLPTARPDRLVSPAAPAPQLLVRASREALRAAAVAEVSGFASPVVETAEAFVRTSTSSTSSSQRSSKSATRNYYRPSRPSGPQALRPSSPQALKPSGPQALMTLLDYCLANHD